MNLTISYFSMTPGSGIPNVCMGLANAFADMADVDVSLLTLVFDRADAAPGVRVRRLMESPRGAHRLFTTRWLRPFADRLYRRGLEELKPDWVLCHYYPLDAFAMRFRERFGHRAAYYYHNVTDPELYEGEERARRRAEEAAMLEQVAAADAVFANSAFTAERIQEAAGRSDAVVSPPAADLSVFHPRPAARARRPTLLHVGRLVKHKGAHLLLDAFQILRSQGVDAELRIVGKPETTAYYREVRERGERMGDVTFVNVLDAQELALEYQRAWVFACASLFEGFGMPFLEAQACGIPCVGFEVCSVPEVVERDRTGLLVPARDVDAFADAARRLLEDDARRAVMGDAAARRAKQFGWERSARIILQRLKQD